MMINTSLLSQHANQDISIQGRLVGLESRVGSNGHPYFRLKLVDGYGDALAYVWQDSPLYCYIQTIDVSDQHLIELYGRIQQLNDYSLIKLNDLYIVSPSHVHNGAALLPLRFVPVRARAAMEWLINFIDRMKNEPLRAFLTGILLDPELGYKFIRSRASNRYHSAYPGGLLVHSVEVARLAGQGGRLLGESELSLAMMHVGALLHDLGKIDTVGERNPRPMSPALYMHEHQTIHLLAPHINALKKASSIEGMLMQHLISRLALPFKGRCPTMAEELIRFADQASAGHKAKQSLTEFIKRLPKQVSANDEAFDMTSSTVAF